MTSSMASIRLGIDEHCIEVTSRHAPALVWLREFLSPAFRELGPDEDAACRRVHFAPSPGRHAELARAMAVARLRTLEGFTLDGSFSLNPGWTAEDGWTWAHEDDGDAFLGVEPGLRSVHVVVRRDAARPRVALMRVVRELATSALLRAGWLPLHASAFVLDGRAVLVCGARRAGKTSLLVHALRCGARFLSNDRVFTGRGVPHVARAMPTIVMLRAGTLEIFDDLKRSFESARYDRGHTLVECAPGAGRAQPAELPAEPPTEPTEDWGKDGISPVQLCRLLDAPMTGAAPVGAILFPRIDEAAAGVELEPMQPGRASESLLRNLLVPCWPPRHSELLAPRAGEGTSAEVLAERCRRLAEGVAALSCRLGPDAFDADLCATLRRAVPSLRPGTTGRSGRGSSPWPRP